MKTKHILGLPFFAGSIDEAIEETIQGALVVAPSGPNLAGELQWLPPYREAVQRADLILTDSSVMVAAFRLITGESVPRHSGLKFLDALLKDSRLKESGAAFWVMPSETESNQIGTWLATQGFPITDKNTYVAPFYRRGAISDPDLLAKIAEAKPKVVFLNLAGGKQEILGAWLRSGQHHRCGIVCTGAAVAFLAGSQVGIPTWADRLGLGWVFRIASNPLKFAPRYWKALPLLPLIWRYRQNLPPAQTAS